MCVGYFHPDFDCFSNWKCSEKGCPNKGGVYLEEMGALKAIAFDKTGTLTKGVPVVTDFNVLNKQVDENEMLSIITALEYRSQHPLASAIMKRAEEANISYSDVVVDDFSSITGKGIKGTVDGTTYYIGSPKLFKELSNSSFDKNLEKKLQLFKIKENCYGCWN